MLDGAACRALLAGGFLALSLVPGEVTKYRWAVKTGTDPAAWSVGSAVVPVTVTALTRLPRPEDVETATPRLAGVEHTVYRVAATVIAYQLESDGDVHVEIRDPATDSTIVVEIPDPARMKAPSAFAAPIAAARATFHRRLGPDMARRRGRGLPIVVTGVGFFDQRHDGDDPAMNGIELHPVTGVTFPLDARPETARRPPGGTAAAVAR